MGSIGASAPIDYLLESLIDPNSKIKENYHSIVVVTDDGRITSGIRLRETPSALILRDAENQIQEIPLASIDQQQDGASLMPAGLIDPLTDAELRDLVRFLSELGKAGSYALPTTRLVRRWETSLQNPEDVVRLRGLGVDFLMDNPAQLQWTPLPARVDGSIPLAELASVRIRPGEPEWSFLRAAVEVGESERVRMVLVGSAEGLRWWLDGRQVTSDHLSQQVLDAGQHMLQVVIDRTVRTQDIRIELVEN
jgi:putative heme-binding domain-containing protein